MKKILSYLLIIILISLTACNLGRSNDFADVNFDFSNISNTAHTNTSTSSSQSVSSIVDNIQQSNPSSTASISSASSRPDSNNTSNNQRKMYYSKIGDCLNIYIQSKESNNFIHYVYMKVANASISLNTWRFYSYEIVDSKFNRLFGVPSSIEMDSVVREPGFGDFIGGFHGYEILTELSVKVDGKKINVLGGNIGLTEFFDEVSCYAVSTMSRNGAPDVKLFTRYKTNTFNINGYFSKQRWVTLQTVTLNTAYMGMMSLPTKEGGQTIVDKAKMDNSDIVQTHSGSAIQNGPLFPSNTVRQIEIYGDKFYGQATYKSSFGNNYRAFCDRFQSTQFKCYFNEVYGEKTFNAGDEISGEMSVKWVF